MDKDTKLIKQILDNLQLLSEKKKVDGMRSVKKGADNNPKVTKMDFLPSKVLDKIAKNKKVNEGDTNKLICPNCGHHNDEGISKCEKCNHPYPSTKGEKAWKEVASESLDSILESFINLDEKKKKRKKKQTKYPKQYSAPEGSKRNADLDRCTQLYKDGKIKQAAKCRQKMEKPHMKENFLLEEALNDKIEETKLDKYLSEIENKIEEKRKRKKKKKSGKSAKGLSAKVKKSLDKKADRRGLTRGSVYAEFRKGLSAFLSSGSRKGMTAHQWAHARVNSANPSKSWAVVKKKKGGKKKKK